MMKFFLIIIIITNICIIDININIIVITNIIIIIIISLFASVAKVVVQVAPTSWILDLTTYVVSNR